MITHVAIRWNGVLYSLPAPNRHFHVIRKIVEETGTDTVDSGSDPDDDQGFLDETGKFYNRVDALAHALEHGQVKNPNDIRAHRLFSEDVW